MTSYDPSLHGCRRGSFSIAWTVEIACGIGNTKEAAKYMAACGVPIDVARRVLLHPGLRRAIK